MSKEKAARIRTALKAELGLNARQVSVRSERCTYSTAIRVTIKAPVAKSKVEAIANREKSVRYCEASGEILMGGNTYVDVGFAEGVLAPLYADALPAIEACRQTPNKSVEVMGFWVEYQTNGPEGFYAWDPKSGSSVSRGAWDAKAMGTTLAMMKLEQNAAEAVSSKG